MAPTIRDAVHRYFEFSLLDNKSKCKICGSLIKGRHATNLKSHVSKTHREEYNQIMTLNEMIVRPSSPGRNATTLTQILQEKCLQLITLHGHPFSLINDKAFQDIINIVVPSQSRTSKINTDSIKAMIPTKAKEIRDKISAEVRNKLVCLKLDSATYMDRCFVGINVQYINSGEIVIRNLAVVEIFDRQTEVFLKGGLMEVLDEFKISSQQVYSITTDNGENYSDDVPMDINDEDNDMNEGEANYFQINENLELNLENIENVIEVGEFKPRAMLCAAYTLQLSIKDAINENIETQSVLNLARQIVKIISGSPIIKNILRLSNLPKPTIDCETRWTSTFNMLTGLKMIRSVCDNNSEISNILTENFWVMLDDIVQCLHPLTEATYNLQKEQLTIGDFFIVWLNYKGKIKTINSCFSISLLNAMKVREVNLLNSEAVLEALYLDGRLNIALSEQEANRAQTLLKQTHAQIIRLQPELNQQLNTPAAQLQDGDDMKFAALEKMLVATERERESHRQRKTFDEELKDIRYAPRLPLDENILKYWSEKRNLIAAVANVVCALPATQVSIERLFSYLKFILSPSRRNMDRKMLEDVILIRSNKDLF